MSWKGSLPRFGSCWESALLLFQYGRSPPMQPVHRFPNARFFTQAQFRRSPLSPPTHSRAFPSPSSSSSPSKSRRYMLSRSFASGLFMFGVPNRASETKAVVTSCSCSCSPSSMDTATRTTLLSERNKQRRSMLMLASLARLTVGTRIFHHDSKTPKDRNGKGKQKGKRNVSYRSDKDSKTYGQKPSKKVYYEKQEYLDKKEYYDQTTGIATKTGDTNGYKVSKGKYTKAAPIALRPPPPPTIEQSVKDTAPGKGVINRIQNMHLASKEELLAAASGAWERMKIRFKWLTIRQVRPFTLDEIGAFFSLLLVGHIVWIVLGTTMFFSLFIWFVNSVQSQEYLAGIIGNYLTKETGVRVVFESAIVPRWGDGYISFKNVYVSRRPGGLKGKNVQKGSRALVLAAAAAAPGGDGELDKLPLVHPSDDEEDQNYTQFDLTIDTVNVTLSLAKWMNGRGLLSSCEIKGVRGVVDRTHVHWDPAVDPRSLRHVHMPGDFEIENFKLEDLLVTVYQPGGFRPFAVSLFSCELPQLRKQWLFYDFLSANHVSGSFDDSLFTIHPRQTHGATFRQINDLGSENGGAYPWKKTSRLRIDGLNIDHLNTGVQGPFGWIQSGNVDIVADVMFPVDPDEGIGRVFQDLMDKMERAVADRKQKFRRMVGSELDSADEYTRYLPNENEDESIDSPTIAEEISAAAAQTMDKRYLIFDLRLQLNDPYAAVPLFTSDLSYVNNALVRPIVAYINSTKTWIPVNCRVVKSLNEFDGSWTMYDSGLMDDLSAETYDAFARDVADANIKKRRMRAVGLWSLQVFMNAFMAAFASAMIL